MSYVFDFGVLVGTLFHSRICTSHGTDGDLWPHNYSFMEVEV